MATTCENLSTTTPSCQSFTSERCVLNSGSSKTEQLSCSVEMLTPGGGQLKHQSSFRSSRSSRNTRFLSVPSGIEALFGRSLFGDHHEFGNFEKLEKGDGFGQLKHTNSLDLLVEKLSKGSKKCKSSESPDSLVRKEKEAIDIDSIEASAFNESFSTNHTSVAKCEKQRNGPGDSKQQHKLTHQNIPGKTQLQISSASTYSSYDKQVQGLYPNSKNVKDVQVAQVVVSGVDKVAGSSRRTLRKRKYCGEVPKLSKQLQIFDQDYRKPVEEIPQNFGEIGTCEKGDATTAGGGGGISTDKAVQTDMFFLEEYIERCGRSQSASGRKPGERQGSQENLHAKRPMRSRSAGATKGSH